VHCYRAFFRKNKIEKNLFESIFHFHQAVTMYKVFANVQQMNSVTTGVGVIITIFCDYRQFSAKKLAFFSKTNVMMIYFQKLAVF
jgi:hypothetical protein